MPKLLTSVLHILLLVQIIDHHERYILTSSHIYCMYINTVVFSHLCILQLILTSENSSSELMFIVKNDRHEIKLTLTLTLKSLNLASLHQGQNKTRHEKARY